MRPTLIACLVLLTLHLPRAQAQREATADVVARPGERVAWFATLASARRAAAASKRPIVLISARPACQGVPGFW